MSEFRILGKSVTVRLTRNGALLSEITAIKSFSFETRHRVITEGYLGETAQRQDEIFDEVGGSIGIHVSGTEILELQRLVTDRSTRRLADDEKVSITFRVAFPNGDSARVTVPDVKIDPIGLNVGSRDGYVDTTISYKSDRYTLTT